MYKEFYKTFNIKPNCSIYNKLIPCMGMESCTECPEFGLLTDQQLFDLCVLLTVNKIKVSKIDNKAELQKEVFNILCREPIFKTTPNRLKIINILGRPQCKQTN